MHSVIWILVCSASAAFTMRETDPRKFKRAVSRSFPSVFHEEATITEIPRSTSNFNLQSSEPLDEAGLEAVAMKWGSENLPLGPGEVLNSTSYLDKTTKLFHAYFTKEHSGLRVYNCQAQLITDIFGAPMYTTNSWLKPGAVSLAKREESITCQDALSKVLTELKIVDDRSSWTETKDGDKTVIQNVDAVSTDVTCSETLYSTGNQMSHVYKVVVPLPTQYLSALVDIKSGVIVAVADLSSNFATSVNGRIMKRQQQQTAFKVQQLGSIAPNVVPASIQIAPEDLQASPGGWLDQNSQTSGNNVIAVDNLQGSRGLNDIISRTVKGPGGKFEFEFTEGADPKQYTSFSVTNAFFLANRYHDILYRYGFDEASGNFQDNNQGKGGRGGDPVLSVSQDATDANNAQFSSPPDGTPGIMRMFMFNSRAGPRDGSLDNSVVLHELTHGLSNRLTGGGQNEACLQSIEAGGMGEGWSDMMALALEMESIDTRNDDKNVGGYVTRNPQSGIREFPYSTNLENNPLKYSSIGKTGGAVHRIGTIWCSMLLEIHWNMVDKKGFDIDFRTNPEGNKGNNQFMALFVQSLKLQPCFPTFITARDAWYAADKLLFQGSNKCEIEKGFAKRGLGLNAKPLANNGAARDDATVSPECQ